MNGAGEDVTAGGVLIFEGTMGYEVHFDTHDGRFSLVDAEMEREWSSLTVEEVRDLHDAMTAALSGGGDPS